MKDCLDSNHPRKLAGGDCCFLGFVVAELNAAAFAESDILKSHLFVTAA